MSRPAPQAAPAGQIAVTMAIRDVAYDGALRIMSEFAEELRNTLA